MRISRTLNVHANITDSNKSIHTTKPMEITDSNKHMRISRTLNVHEMRISRTLNVHENITDSNKHTTKPMGYVNMTHM